MNRKISIILVLIVSFIRMAAYADDYNARQAKQYTKEAEYYQKKADGYRREAEYYLKKAVGYQREAAYYTRKGDADRAKTQMRYAENAMDKYKTQLKYATNAEDKAADYLRKASNILRKLNTINIIKYGQYEYIQEDNHHKGRGNCNGHNKTGGRKNNGFSCSKRNWQT